MNPLDFEKSSKKKHVDQIFEIVEIAIYFDVWIEINMSFDRNVSGKLIYSLD